MKDCAALVRELYAIVGELEHLYPGRPFTPDGHLVGSIGEALAQSRYGLELLPCSTAEHDAKARDGRLVQIKATQGSRVGLYANPQHLIVLRLTRDGSTEEVFNGPGQVAWAHVSKVAKNGQRSISVAQLRRLMLCVSPDQRLLEAASTQRTRSASTPGTGQRPGGLCG
jgi:hypothetical protein